MIQKLLLAKYQGPQYTLCFLLLLSTLQNNGSLTVDSR